MKQTRTCLNVSSSSLSTELIALNDDLLQLASELNVHVLKPAYLQQRCLSAQGTDQLVHAISDDII